MFHSSAGENGVSRKLKDGPDKSELSVTCGIDGADGIEKYCIICSWGMQQPGLGVSVTSLTAAFILSRNSFCSLVACFISWFFEMYGFLLGRMGRMYVLFL